MLKVHEFNYNAGIPNRVRRKWQAGIVRKLNSWMRPNYRTPFCANYFHSLVAPESHFPDFIDERVPKSHHLHDSREDTCDCYVERVLNADSCGVAAINQVWFHNNLSCHRLEVWQQQCRNKTNDWYADLGEMIYKYRKLGNDPEI